MDNLFASVGTATIWSTTNQVFHALSPFLILILGVILGFAIISSIIEALNEATKKVQAEGKRLDETKEIQKTLAPFENWGDEDINAFEQVVSRRKKLYNLAKEKKKYYK